MLAAVTCGPTCMGAHVCVCARAVCRGPVWWPRSCGVLEAAVAPRTARRRVIDLAGNGRTDDLEKMLATRDRLLADGVVINALAIEEDDDELTRYYLRELAGGPGAFVVTADEFKDFTEAMQIKLYREISGAVVSEGAPPPDTTIIIALDGAQIRPMPTTDNSGRP